MFSRNHFSVAGFLKFHFLLNTFYNTAIIQKTGQACLKICIAKSHLKYKNEILEKNFYTNWNTSEYACIAANALWYHVQQM